MNITFEFYTFQEGFIPNPVRLEDLTIKAKVPQIGSTVSFDIFGYDPKLGIINSNKWLVKDVNIAYIVRSETTEEHATVILHQSN